MSHILFTGFTPFDGRQYNASWIAAKDLCANHGTHHIAHSLRIPVCWGEPSQHLIRAVERWRPRIIISMGEGKPGQFTLESRARNTRAQRQDNNGSLPQDKLIEANGDSVRYSSAPLSSIANALRESGINAQCSDDAGAFLCEELLYGLEGLKAQTSHVELVIFAHVPPFGTELEYRGKHTQCDAALLQHFTKSLLFTALDHCPQAL